MDRRAALKARERGAVVEDISAAERRMLRDVPEGERLERLREIRREKSERMQEALAEPLKGVHKSTIEQTLGRVRAGHPVNRATRRDWAKKSFQGLGPSASSPASRKPGKSGARAAGVIQARYRLQTRSTAQGPQARVEVLIRPDGVSGEQAGAFTKKAGEVAWCFVPKKARGVDGLLAAGFVARLVAEARRNLKASLAPAAVELKPLEASDAQDSIDGGTS